MRKLLAVLIAALVAVITIPTIAFAEGSDATTSSLKLDALTVQVAVGMLIPIVVGLITKFSTSSGVKALAMLILNAVQTLIVTATMADGTAIISKQTFIAWALALVVSVASYAGVYKPLNVTSSTETGKLKPGKGLL